MFAFCSFLLLVNPLCHGNERDSIQVHVDASALLLAKDSRSSEVPVAYDGRLSRPKIEKSTCGRLLLPSDTTT
jgi:hypothetical protein